MNLRNMSSARRKPARRGVPVTVLRRGATAAEVALRDAKLSGASNVKISLEGDFLNVFCINKKLKRDGNYG
jgi:NADPH-dependent glutamate synthase beta subunit-like oxidoreductase